MKRLNPETSKPFVRGDTRADGFIFWGYYKGRIRKTGFYAELWFSKETFDKKLTYSRKYRDKNSEYYALHRNKNKQKQKQYRKKHLIKNPARVNIDASKRRASKLKRTPAWLTANQLKQIEAFYVEATRLSLLTGILHCVDHIVPLRGKVVSGLHVPWNLQVITEKENLTKSNKF